MGDSLEQIKYLSQILAEVQMRCPDIRIIAFASESVEEYEPSHYLCFNSYEDYDDWHYIKNLINEENDERFGTNIFEECPDLDAYGGVSSEFGDEDNESDY